MTILKSRIAFFPKKTFYLIVVFWIGLVLFSKFNFIRAFPNDSGQIWILTIYSSLELSCYGVPLIFCVSLISLKNNLPVTTMLLSRLDNGRKQLFALDIMSILITAASFQSQTYLAFS